jgi:hypothetical protein
MKYLPLHEQDKKLVKTPLSWVLNVRYIQGFEYHSKASAQLIAPTSKQWQRFWKRVDAIGVWNWKSRHENPAVLDGTSWRVEIAHNGKYVSSSGNNDYPDGDTMIAFEAFLKAVRELIGDRPFC